MSITNDTVLAMPQHIGIVACSAEGAALCYRTICAEGAKLICPDNTVHSALGYVLTKSPRPWLHIAEVVASEAARRGCTRLGLAGTRWLVDSETYPEKLAAFDLECIRPSAAERDEIHRVIMDELVYGVFTPQGLACCQQVFARRRDRGCDAVILGCTEPPLIVNEANSPLPTLDSSRLLSMAALQRAVQGGGI